MPNKFKPDIHHRRSIRLRHYDYASEGAYSVTICAQNRECLYGEIVNGEMVLNDAGGVVESVWCALPGRFPSIELDAFVVMPNHFHGIIVICDSHADISVKGGSPAPTLGDIVCTFKSISA